MVRSCLPFGRAWRISSVDTDLLASLHGGGHETPPWRAFLSRLQRQCGADAALLSLAPHDGPTALSHWTSMLGVAPPALDFAKVRQLRPMRVYALAELEDGAKHADERSARFGRVVRVGGSDGWSGWVVIIRVNNDLAAADSALLSALAPHVAIALRNHVSIERERVRAAIMEDVLRRAGIRLQITDNQPLGSASPTSHESGTALLDGQRETLLIPAPSIGAEPASEETLVARVQHPVRPEQIQCLARLWSLTPSEARFAMTVAEGTSLSEAAEALGLTIETARHYSKRLYAKTGARGLPDLVRRVLTSVAMLA